MNPKDEHGPYCEQCGECLKCYHEGCLFSEDGQHVVDSYYLNAIKCPNCGGGLERLPDSYRDSDEWPDYECYDCGADYWESDLAAVGDVDKDKKA